MTKYFKVLHNRGEIEISHPEVLAAFILYGEIPIFSNNDMEVEQKIYLVEHIIDKLLR